MIILITNKDLMNFYSCSKNTATKWRSDICDTLGIKDSEKRINIFQFAQYVGLPAHQLEEILKM